MKAFKLLFLFIVSPLTSFSQDGTGPCDDPFQPLGYNRIINGDFEAGSNAFGTDFQQDPFCSPNTYYIFSPSQTYCGELAPIMDHTSGDGNFLSITSTFNGDLTQTIWRQNVDLIQGQEYVFSYWLIDTDMNPTPAQGPVISFNTQLATITPIATTNVNDQSFSTLNWQKVCTSFIANATGNHTISLTLNYSSNSPTGETTRFILDDLRLSPIYQTAYSMAQESAQLMIKYEPGTSQQAIDAIRMEAGAELVDSCACGNLDLWLITQFPIVIDGDTIFDIETLREKSKDKAEIETSDYNYYANSYFKDMEFQPASYSGSPMVSPHAATSSDSCEVVVAVIDTGVDYTHSDLAEYMWDACYPCACPTDGTRGYDYANDDNDAFDDFGHGTHVAGIIKDDYINNNNNPDYPIRIMPVKALDHTGSGSLFDIICSMLYAVENDADVINLSFGYQGDSSQILYNAIDYAKIQNEIVVVASAGNSGSNNDLYPHFPSDHNNPNLISVAADTIGMAGGLELTGYSCYSGTKVDISAFGTRASTWPGDTTITLSGTSISAPQIAAAAALAKPYYTTAAGIKNLILTSGTPLSPIGKPIWTDDSFHIANFLTTLGGMGNGLTCDNSDFGKETNYSVFLDQINIVDNPTEKTVTIAGDFSDAKIDILNPALQVIHTFTETAGPVTIDLDCLGAGKHYLRISSISNPNLWTWTFLKQ